MANGCPRRVLNKIYRSWEDLNARGIVREGWVSDDVFEIVIRNAEEDFGLTERDQYHELFWMDCKRLLDDEIQEKAHERRMNKPVWARM